MVTIPKTRARTTRRRTAPVSIVIPAHNEEDTIATVVSEALTSLNQLDVPGEVIVSASGCTDNTAGRADQAGAKVVTADVGKGSAILTGVNASSGDVICLLDGDLAYYGDTPLAVILVEPILRGIADATIANLYWRPIYPDTWLNGLFVPLAGYLFPELLPKAGNTPWSGQRAAVRGLWPSELPSGFTVDLAITLHWNRHAEQLRPVLTDDWFNPLRPKPEILRLDFELLLDHATTAGRLDPDHIGNIRVWFEQVQRRVDEYDDNHPDPIGYQRDLLDTSIRTLHDLLHL